MWVANEAGKIKEPHRCLNQACGAKQMMKLVHNQCLYSDKQLVKIQESPNLIPEGETPHAVTAFVYDALVDFVRPGDRITLVGALLIWSLLCSKRGLPVGCVSCRYQHFTGAHCRQHAANIRRQSASRPLISAAGMYRALTVRPNPRLRMVNSVLRTYIDVMHISINQKDIIFKGSAPMASMEEDELPGTPGTPGTPASREGSVCGSQVRVWGCSVRSARSGCCHFQLIRMFVCVKAADGAYK